MLNVLFVMARSLWFAWFIWMVTGPAVPYRIIVFTLFILEAWVQFGRHEDNRDPDSKMWFFSLIAPPTWFVGYILGIPA